MTGRSRGRGRGRGGFKSASYIKKRPSPTSDTEEPASRPSKKSKSTRDNEEEDEESTEPFVPTLQTDSDGNPYIPLKSNSLRRLTFSTFKSQTLLSIREYYTNDAGDVLPGKKGIALTVEQFDALVRGLPLLEGVLRERGVEGIGRPEYSTLEESEGKDKGKEEVGEEEEEEEADENEEDKE